MKEKQRIYSYRKFKGIGLASAVIGLAFFGPSFDGGGVIVHAESVTGDSVEHGNRNAVEEKPDKVVLKTSEEAGGGVVNTVNKTSETVNKVSEAATTDAPRPEGNVVARGEDGVPWELYENGYLLFKPEAGKDTLTNNEGDSSWKREHGAQIKHVGFAGKVYAPISSARLFGKYGAHDNFKFNPVTLDTTNLDTSKVADMESMFEGLSQLTSLDVTHFDTSEVTNMKSIFSSMSKLTSLDVTHFDTSKVTNMESMFEGLSQLTSLDVTHFDTSKVKNMYAMFSGMSKLTSLDVTHFNTSNVTTMGYMFNRVLDLTNLDVTHFNTSKVTNMGHMFSEVRNLTNLDVTHFDTSKVTNMESMFYDTRNLTNLDVTNFDTSKVTNMGYMFYNTRNLTNLDVTQFDTSKVTNMEFMFYNASNLTNLDVTHFDTGKVTNMGYMFSGTSNLTNLDVTHFDTRNVTNMEFMFNELSKLTSLDVTHFDTSKVTNMGHMFNGLSKLTSLGVTHFDTRNVTNMSFMFSNMPNLTNLDVTNFDTRNVKNMYAMFSYTSKLTSLDVTHFDTSNVTNMGHMFSFMSKLTSLDVTHFDTSKVTNMGYMFSYSGELKELQLGDKFQAAGIDTVVGVGHSYGEKYTNKWHKMNDREHPYTVGDWANLYKANPSGAAGTWVREEVNPQETTLTFNGETLPPVKVTPNAPTLPELPRPVQPKPNHKFKGWSRTPGGEPIKPTDIQPGETLDLHPIWEAVDNTQTRTAKIPVTKTYEADNTLDYGKQTETPGVEGEKTITTTYTVTPYTGELTNPVESEVITTPMKPTVVNVGTKPTDAVEVIPSPKQYVKDDKRVKGEPDEVTQGTPGSKTTTTTYTVDPTNGTVTPKQGEPVTVQPTPTIVKVAAKDKTDVESIPSPVVYEADKNRAKGTPDERTEGTPGSSTTVTTYTVNPQDGTVTENVGEPMRKEPTNTVVKVGAKDKVEETPIEPTVVYEKDDTRDEGTPNETIPGEKGKTVTTTTYDVNPKDGTVTGKVGEPVVTPAGVTKVKVGAKTKVVRSKDDQGRDVIDTTTYEVDPNNGNVTPTTVRTYGTEKEPTVDKKPVPSPVVYEADKDRAKGTPDERVEGEPGEDTITTTYTVDPNTGEITPTVGQPVRTKVPTNTVVKVGAKDKVEETPIEPTVVYEKDDTRDEGTPNETIPGEKGKTVTTTTYDVNPKDGTVTGKVGEPVVTPAGVTKVKVGAKTKVVRSKDDQGRDVIDTTTYEVDPNNGNVTPTTVRTYGTEKEPTVDKKPVPSPVVYEADKDRAKGTPDERVEGEPGEDTITTTYTVDPNTGEITPTVGQPVRTKVPTNTVVKVGAKDKVEETPIEPTVVYEKDDTRDEGTPNETIPGEKGKTVTTTTYDVNPKDGTVTEKVGEPVVTPAGVTKVKVGAKTKVEIIKDGGKTIQRTTSYDVDPNNGKVTPHVNDQIIGDNGDVTPPTVEIPEYTDPIGGSLDGKGNIVTPPTVDIPEYTDPIGGSLDGEGNIVTPPTADIPEYTDPIGGALDGEGNIVTPPTVEIPEYTDPIGGSLDGEGNIVTPPTVDIPTYEEPEQPQGIKSGAYDENGNPIAPPTVEIPEYTGAIGGSLDGEGNIVTPPTVDIPEYTGAIGGSLDGEGNIVTPPTVEIPEYTGAIGGPLDGEGNIVTPPTVDIPEYTGAIGGSFDSEGNIVTPPTVEIPEYTETEQPQTLKPEITPPTVDKPEYTGPIGGAGLDGEGNLITPPTVDRPAYTGDIEPTVERQVIPAGKRYEKDTSREKGQPNITIPGKDGSVTTTFHYHVDKDGNVISSKGSSVTEEPVATVIKVAAKDKVEMKVVESPKRYVGDATKELGDDSETPGTPGEVRIRTIYDVNPETGEITERTEKELRVVPTETVITKGTKPTVKTVERDGKVYEQTTTYTVNEKTGELTSSTTEKLIKDVEKQTETQKQLPNTGDAGALASLAGLGVGLLGVRLGRKREE